MPEYRTNPRFEPILVDVEVYFNNSKFVGQVLDSSHGGMAISFPEDITLPNPLIGEIVKLSVYKHSNPHTTINLGNSMVLRSWEKGGLTEDEKGIAVQFDHNIYDEVVGKLLFYGIKQNERLASQEKISNIDMNFLGNYRRDMVECQMRLFILALSVCSTLAGGYFALIYYSYAIDKIFDQNLIFWRTMVAVLPGLLATACLLMTAQKSISIQRIDAYLSVMKGYRILKHFPREYKGWEIENWKIRHVLGGDQCKSCIVNRKCGEMQKDFKDKIKTKNILFQPFIDIYHVVINSSYYLIISLSLLAMGYELLRVTLTTRSYIIITFVLTLIFVAGVAFSIYIFWHLRKGKYSYEYFRLCWIDLLGRCRVQI